MAVFVPSPSRLSAGITVPGPAWSIQYRGKNITNEISGMVLKVIYTSAIHGASPGLELEVEDSRKLWQNSSYPTRGDRVSLAIGYSDSALIPCPIFLVDELELKGPPDTFTLRCQSVFITQSLRTPVSNGYEGDTLLGIAEKIAGKYGMDVVGIANDINPAFARVTQKQETDLAFLSRLANEYGYNFTVRSNANPPNKPQLVFTYRATLEEAKPAATVRRQNVTHFTFKNSTQQVFKNATASYFDPITKSLISFTVEANPPQPSGDTLPASGERCESAEQARLKAKSLLHRANSLYAANGSLEAVGSTAFAAGNNIMVSGFGVYDGKYAINKAVHTLTRKGYTTKLEISLIPQTTGEFV